MNVFASAATLRVQNMSDWQWQFALIFVGFTATYLNINASTYAPYMVVNLIESATPENAGKYSGFITSCFVTGRTMSSDFWGRYADKHGRVKTIQLSLALCAIFTLLFGMSNRYAWALVWRAALGVSCPLAILVKTCVTEIASKSTGGVENIEFEANVMNSVISSHAMGVLVAPYVAGILSDPISSFPNSIFLQNSSLGHLVDKFPYLLPNVVGSAFCLASMLIVRLFLVETLPPPSTAASETNAKPAQRKRHDLGTIQESESFRPSESDRDDEDEEALLAQISDELASTFGSNDLENAIRESYLHRSDDVAGGAVMTKAARRSMVSGISRRTSAALVERRERQQQQQQQQPAENPTTLTFLKDKDIRRNLILTTFAVFAALMLSECIPLFCLSKEAGLGVSEYILGSIQSADGLIYLLIQPWLYTQVFRCTGLHGSVKAGLVLSVPTYFLIPFSISARDKGSGNLHWQAFAFLSIVTGLKRIFTTTAFCGLFVDMNRLVVSRHRASLNALSMKITSGCSGAAPILAGFFATTCFALAPAWGATILFGTIGLVGLAAAILALVFLDSEKED